MTTSLVLYIEREILPRYERFDAAHREDHVQMVIKQSLEIAKHYPVIQEMVYAIAAFHDLGLEVDRKTHHLESGCIVRETEQLKEWFSPEEIETMAQAVEDHRASSDRYPELDKEGHWRRTLDHLHEKYAEGGYLKLWFPESPNVARLESLREIIKDEARLRLIFERIYTSLL